MLFRPEKWSFKIVQEIAIFPKELVQAFCQKFKLFFSCVSGEIRPEKIAFGYFGRKRTLFRPGKWSLKKVQKTEIFAIVNNWNFLAIVFFGKSSQKRSILDVLDRKERFLDHKHYLKKPNKTAWVVEVVVVKKNLHQWQRNSICYCGYGDCYFFPTKLSIWYGFLHFGGVELPLGA